MWSFTSALSILLDCECLDTGSDVLEIELLCFVKQSRSHGLKLTLPQLVNKSPHVMKPWTTSPCAQHPSLVPIYNQCTILSLQFFSIHFNIIPTQVVLYGRQSIELCLAVVEERKCLEDRCVDGRIIRRWILKNQMKWCGVVHLAQDRGERRDYVSTAMNTRVL
jgi:hypothetical protein